MSHQNKNKKIHFALKVYHANMIGSIQQIDGSDNISVSKLHLSKAVTCSYAR